MGDREPAPDDVVREDPAGSVGIHGRFAYELFAGDKTTRIEMLTAQERMLTGV